jgi:hypothetical protein
MDTPSCAARDRALETEQARADLRAAAADVAIARGDVSTHPLSEGARSALDAAHARYATVRGRLDSLTAPTGDDAA